jgi:hypothetical protein
MRHFTIGAIIGTNFTMNDGMMEGRNEKGLIEKNDEIRNKRT